MSTKWFVPGLIIVAFVAGILLLTVGAVPVRAQCGEPQDLFCVNCHPEQAQYKASDGWHSSHYSIASCTNCHGGNATAAEKDPAHEDLVANPLSDIYTSCHQCHPKDYQTVASGYAATLNVAPGSCTTPTPFPQGNLPGGFSGGNGILPSNHETIIILGQSIGWIAGSLAVLAVFFGGLSWLEKHRLSQ
ncbi:MAG: hypothetical protein D4R46_01165 [Chloroflexi bacterium]|nr:MAG: hypothetical protein D4R46_01165 [Chloroflexota bacterium]